MRQALQLADIEDTTVALLKHCVWNICHLLQQCPHLLYYTMITDITLCVLATSTGDPHSSVISLETNIPVKFSKLLIAYYHICQCINFLEHDSFEKFNLFPYD